MEAESSGDFDPMLNVDVIGLDRVPQTTNDLRRDLSRLEMRASYTWEGMHRGTIRQMVIRVVPGGGSKGSRAAQIGRSLWENKSAPP